MFKLLVTGGASIRLHWRTTISDTGNVIESGFRFNCLTFRICPRQPTDRWHDTKKHRATTAPAPPALALLGNPDDPTGLGLPGERRVLGHGGIECGRVLVQKGDRPSRHEVDMSGGALHGARDLARASIEDVAHRVDHLGRPAQDTDVRGDLIALEH